VSAESCRLFCAGCGAEISLAEPFPFRCPRARAGDDIDHVVTVAVDLEGRSLCGSGLDEGTNPFVYFRELHCAWHVARERGLSDAAYVALVEEIDRAVAKVDGRGFRVTPYRRERELSRALGGDESGGIWVKDETGNVSGSHKARHLMGLAIHLEVAERTGLAAPGATPGLGIASCGNAALAAAALARAVGRPLEVFVPPWADAPVVARLEALKATLTRCPRSPGDPPGDPCYLRFREAVHAGTLPFTCQGSENGLTIEGGKTLGWELACQHAALGGPPLDCLAIQVGGGALASSCAQALRIARDLGVLPRLPRIHAVQTEGGHPLERAWRRVARAMLERLAAEGDASAEPEALSDAELAAWLRQRPDAIREVLERAARSRSGYMWPWEEEPTSAASGILDDETYDWLEIVRAMLETGGWPVVVSEAQIARAHEVARKTTGIDVDPTGSAGLAGLLALRERGDLRAGENAAVLFTGVQR